MYFKVLPDMCISVTYFLFRVVNEICKGIIISSEWKKKISLMIKLGEIIVEFSFGMIKRFVHTSIKDVRGHFKPIYS